jgi:hypothetical protein
MKATILILSIIFLVGCQKKQPIRNCIEFIDSLAINLGNTTLKVAMIDLVLENNVRPYSIFIDNYLIVLNKKDAFYAFDLSCFERDTIFEQKLNTKKGLKRAFASFGNLYGVDENNQAFKFERETAKWTEGNDLPFFNRMPIYENDKYLCYSLCDKNGFVFFYNKHTEKITFVVATCAVSLIEDDSGGFYIVSNSFDHVVRSYINYIQNPDSLFKLPDTLVYFPDQWEEVLFYRSIMRADRTISNTDYLQFADVTTFDKNRNAIRPNYVYEKREEYLKETIIMAGFRINDENYYLADKNLIKLRDDSLVVVNTLDAILSRIYWSESITRKANNNTVIDYTWYADEGDLQSDKYADRNLLTRTIIINDTSLIRINWKR